MARFTKSKHYAVLSLLALVTGCALPAGRSEPNPDAPAVNLGRTISPSATEPQAASRTTSRVSQVSYQAPTAPEPAPATSDGPAPLPEAVPSRPSQPPLKAAQSQHEVSGPASRQSAYRSDDPSDPFVGQAELPVEQLVAEVQARNPSLQAVSSAWRAAADRYPQVVSLDDPMFTYMISPGGVGMDRGGGWMVQASQKIPWAGKRALRGSAAAAEADAMQGDIGDTRLRLAEAARTAFYDYYLARRQMEVNASTHGLLTQFREIAQQKYEVNQTTQQDVLQADVELASLESRRTELTRDERVAIARINTLLHRAADHPLPPPPAKVPASGTLPAAKALQQAALQSRPDLFALQARIRAEEASLALACREYYPDLNLFAKYDGFMPEDMRPAVGMDINIPIRYARRSAAAREASERTEQRRAEYEDRLDQVRYEVQSALDRATQSQRVVHLFEGRILPAAQRSLESAQANYTSGKLDFLRLLDAERQLNTQREMYYQSIAESHRRLAELEHAVGEPVRTSP